MDYDIMKVVPTEIAYDIDIGLPYGKMPYDMLTSKFEETDMGPDEHMYDDYARTTLTDWRPDQNRFEHEEARGAVNARAGRIELQYYGHRGQADDPAHPEMFLGHGCPEDADPRGTAVDPDMRELRRQQDARMRFVRWTADACPHDTGGGRSETQEIRDRQAAYGAMKSHLKVFDHQRDGLRNPLRREWQHKGAIESQVRVQSYGDLIQDYALNPQRRATIICKEIIRNSRAYRNETADQDFQLARYTQLCRRAKRKPEQLRRDATTLDAEFASSDRTLAYHAMGVLMSQITEQKKQTIAGMRSSDIDFEEAKVTATKRSMPFQRDLAIIMQSVACEQEFNSGTATQHRSTAVPVPLAHGATITAQDAIAPAHQQLNAELIYRGVKPGADLRKVKDNIVTDSRDPQPFKEVGAAKSAKREQASGRKLATVDTMSYGESDATHQYKSLKEQRDLRARRESGEDFAHESDATQFRKKNHANYRVEAPDDTQQDMRFGRVGTQDRHGRRVGSKYMTRFVDRDEKFDEVTSSNN